MKCYLRSHKDRNPIYRMTFSKCFCLRVFVAQRCSDGKLIIRQQSEVSVNTRFVTKLMPVTSLVVWWSELLTTNHEVPGSIPGSTMGIFLVGGGSPW